MAATCFDRLEDVRSARRSDECVDAFLAARGWGYAESLYTRATVANYRSVYRRHVQPLVGHLPLGELTATRAVSVGTELREAGAAKATAKLAVAFCRTVRTWAVAVGSLEVESVPLRSVRDATLALGAQQPAEYVRADEEWRAHWCWRPPPSVAGCECRWCRIAEEAFPLMLGVDEEQALDELSDYCRRHALSGSTPAAIETLLAREEKTGRRRYPASDRRSLQRVAGDLGKVVRRATSSGARGWFWLPRVSVRACTCRHCVADRRRTAAFLGPDRATAETTLEHFIAAHGLTILQERAPCGASVRYQERPPPRVQVITAANLRECLTIEPGPPFDPNRPAAMPEIPEPRPPMKREWQAPGYYLSPPPAREACACRYCLASRARSEVLLGDEIDAALAAFEHYEGVHARPRDVSGKETACARLQRIAGPAAFVVPYRRHHHWVGWHWYPPPARPGCWCIDCRHVDDQRSTYLGHSEREARRHLEEYIEIHRLPLNAFFRLDIGSV